MDKKKSGQALLGKQRVIRYCVSTLLLCVLAACNVIPEQARQQLIGVKRSDLVSCAGVPDHEERQDGQDVLVWLNEKTSGGSLSLSVPFDLSLTFNSQGACHVIATVRDGTVVKLAYSGPARTWEGENALCAPVLRACLLTSK